MAREQRAPTIRWTPEEWDAVVEAGARYFLTGAADNQSRAFKLANEDMPLDKRRLRSPKATLSPTSFKDWTSRWEKSLQIVGQKLHEGIPAQVLQAESAQEFAPVDLHASSPIEAESAQASLPTQEQVLTPAPNLMQLMFQELSNMMLTVLESPRGQEAIRNAFKVPAGIPTASAITVEQNPHQAGIKAPTVLRKRSILIVGLLGQQQQEVTKAFGEAFDIRFLGSDASHARIKQNASQVDTVYAMVGFINHSMYNHMKKNSKQFVHVNGTVSDVKRLLTGLTHS